MGDLLDQVRVSGENAGLANEIRDLGLGYGVVTPYTSFVIVAPADGTASTSNMALYQDPAQLNQSSGQVTIQARVQNQAYQQASQASLAVGANTLNVGHHSVAQLPNTAAPVQNIDLSVFQGKKIPGEPVTSEWIERNIGVDRRIVFGSKEYFELATQAEARPFLQSGVNVIFAYDGKTIQVHEEDSGRHPRPDTPQADPTVTEPWWTSVLRQAYQFAQEIVALSR